MLQHLLAAFVAIVISATGVLAHDAQSVATSIADLVSPATATSVTYARAPDASQTAAAASATSSETDANSNSSANSRNSTTQQLFSLSSGQYSASGDQYSSPGATSAVAAANAATNPSDANVSPSPSSPSGRVLGAATSAFDPTAADLSSRLNSLIGIVGDLATLIPVSAPQQQAPVFDQSIAGDGNALNPYAGANAVSSLTNTTITTPTINTPTISGGSISGATVSGYLPLAGGALTGTLTGTNLTLSGTASTTNLIVSSASGTAGCATFDIIGTISNTHSACGSGGGSAFPFTPTTFGSTAANATSTLTGFTNGLYVLASSTIGGGTQAGGLTISGGATTTGFLVVQGAATSTFQSGLSASALNLTSSSATSTASNGFNLSGGCFAVNGTCLGGGGGGSLQTQLGSSFTVAAGQSVSAGDFVSMLGDGTVERSSAIGLGFGVPAFYNSNTNNFVITTLDSAHFVLAYNDSTNGNALSTEVGSVSGTTITFGTGALATSSTNASKVIADLDATHFVLAYPDTTNSNKLSAEVGSVSGTAITFGTGALATSSTNAPVIAGLDATHFALAYNDSTNGSKLSAEVGSVSGITITFGTGALATSSTSINKVISTLDATHFVLAYPDNTNSNKLTAQVASVSGTAITFGTGALATSSTNAPVIADLDATHFVLAYQDSTNSSKLSIQVGSVSGTTITFGVGLLVSNSTSVAVITTLDSTHFVLAYSDTTNGSKLTSQICSVSGTVITCGSAVVPTNSANVPVITTLDAAHFALAYRDSTNGNKQTSQVCSVSGITVTCGSAVVASNSTNVPVIADLDSTHFALAYQDSTNSSFNTGVVGKFSSLASSTGIGIASAAASAGQSVNVIFQGIASGFSNLTVGTVYYANGDGTVTASTTPNLLGVAVSSTQILLNNSSSVNSLTQFFGDAVFQNGFRITEAQSGLQALDFLNQFGQRVASFDENGNLTISGVLSALNPFALPDATTTASSTIAASFAGASDALKSALSALGDTVIRLLGHAVYAATGIFDHVIARDVTTDKLCITKSDGTSICVTGDQFAGVFGAGVASSTPISVSSSSTPDLTNSGNPAHANQNSSSTPPATSAGGPPTIQINGDNPAVIHVGDSYQDLGATITGPTDADKNLGLKYFLNGALVSDIVIDTGAPATDTIDYVATDASGLTSTSTRTVIIEALPPSPPPPIAASSTSAAAATSSTAQ